MWAVLSRGMIKFKTLSWRMSVCCFELHIYLGIWPDAWIVLWTEESIYRRIHEQLHGSIERLMVV
jgi:hypothetical protein